MEGYIGGDREEEMMPVHKFGRCETEEVEGTIQRRERLLIALKETR